MWGGGGGGPSREPSGQLFGGGGLVSGEGWRNPFPRGVGRGRKGGTSVLNCCGGGRQPWGSWSPQLNLWSFCRTPIPAAGDGQDILHQKSDFLPPPLFRNNISADKMPINF